MDFWLSAYLLSNFPFITFAICKFKVNYKRCNHVPSCSNCLQAFYYHFSVCLFIFHRNIDLLWILSPKPENCMRSPFRRRPTLTPEEQISSLVHCILTITLLYPVSHLEIMATSSPIRKGCQTKVRELVEWTIGKSLKVGHWFDEYPHCQFSSSTQEWFRIIFRFCLRTNGS